jgi:hypothetical protein
MPGVGRLTLAKVINMKAYQALLSPLLLAVLLPPCFVSAQQALSEAKVARKLDEYAYGSGSGVRVGNDCDVDAHLDNFAYYLKAEPGSRGYMIFYRGKRKPPRYFAYNPEWQFSELNFEWKFEEGRVVLVDGGYREEAMMELWIVPEGAKAPEPAPTVFPGKRRER